MLRTTANDLPLVPQALSGSDELGGQMIEVATADTGQLHPLEVIPEPLSSLQSICPRRLVKVKHETLFMLLLRFTTLGQSDSLLE